MSLSKLTKEQLAQTIKAKKLFDEAIHFSVVGGDPRKEIPMLNKVIKLDPEAYWAYITKAGSLNTIAQPGSKDYAKLTLEAKYCLDTAYAIKPDSPQVVYAKLKIEHKDASKADTEATMRHILELPAVTLRDHIAQARAYKALGAKDLELRKYQDLSQMPEYAQNLEVWFGLGSRLNDAKRFGEAASAYQQVTNIWPKYVNGWAGLGYSLMKAGRNLEAEEAMRHALKLAPKNLENLHNLAMTLSNLDRYEESMAIEQKILKIDSSNADAHHGISLDMKCIADRDLASKPKAYQKALEKALVESNKALAQEPDNVVYLAGKADVLVGLKRSGEALNIILNVEKLLPAAEKAELHTVLPFIEDVLAHKAALKVDLKLTDQDLQDMIEAIVGLDDSGTDEHDGLTGVDSGDSDHSQ